MSIFTDQGGGHKQSLRWRGCSKDGAAVGPALNVKMIIVTVIISKMIIITVTYHNQDDDHQSHHLQEYHDHRHHIQEYHNHCHHFKMIIITMIVFVIMMTNGDDIVDYTMMT